jgi:hypothetical protein
VESDDLLLKLAVDGESLMLAQVLQQGLDEEFFQVPSSSRRIDEEPPPEELHHDANLLQLSHSGVER